MQRDLLIVGPGGPHAAAIARRLSRDGHGVIVVTDAPASFPCETTVVDAPDLAHADLAALLAQHAPDFQPRAVVVIPHRPAAASIDATPAEDFVAATDRALVGAEVTARYFLARRAPGKHGQLVLVSGWAAMGLPYASTAAAISGGLIGLARSWALELGSSGISVNAVVAGAGVEGSGWENAVPPIGHTPTADEVAHAVAFFVDERSAAVNGQVLFVCGGLTPGIVSI